VSSGFFLDKDLTNDHVSGKIAFAVPDTESHNQFSL